MSITQGQDIKASDFIASSAGSGDVGKVPKLDGNGKLDPSFLNVSFPVAKTLFPSPLAFSNPGTGDGCPNTVTMKLGKISVDYAITLNKITLMIYGSLSGSGNLILSLYSEDGQTRLFTVTKAMTSGQSGYVTITIPTITLPAGVYLLGVQYGTGLAGAFQFYSVYMPFSSGYMGIPSGTIASQGKYTVVANTSPTTITMANITFVGGDDASILCSRWDN